MCACVRRGPFKLKVLLEQAGLWVINAIARSVPATKETLAFGEHPRHRLDWYRRRDGDSIATVVFFYGGNWRSGERGYYRFVADTLMKLGFDVVVPDYRLYPHVRFGDILADATAAVERVLERTDHDLFLTGHSAGAQLAALLTLNTRLLSAPDRIRGMIGLAGPYDFYPFTEEDHWDLFGPEEDHPESQPVNFVRADAPPLYLLHGGDDRRVRRGHSKSLMLKQRAAGGRAAREVYPDMSHVGIVLEFARFRRGRSAVVADIAAFLKDPDSPDRYRE